MDADGGSGGMMGGLEDIFEALAHRVVASGVSGLVLFLRGGKRFFFCRSPFREWMAKNVSDGGLWRGWFVENI